ncbi:DUF86 domain-containing protein [Leptospira licerasiae]|uniref:HepT-like ribonuclease domain-containing protein n=1 Tax=Leptospira licerasiae TaxID=447106 RepID=UPI003019EFC5
MINSEEEITILDSIAMRLQAIGDNVKSISKLDPIFLSNYPETDWVKIMRMRGIVSHHYEGLDHEIIFSICKDKLKDLKSSIIDILNMHNGF